MARPLRYTLILISVGLGAALAAVGGWRYARASAPLSGPIVVISIDTLRADHLPVYGYTRLKTPAIDQLAADGVVFERAYSHVPQTLPAHVAMLSGRLPAKTGVHDDVGTPVKAGERLLPAMLRDRGYATAAVVSSYLLRKQTGIDQGFDFFDGDVPVLSADIAEDEIRRDGAESEARAERWLDSIGTSRAFLFLHLNEPHAPYDPPARFSQFSPYDGEIAYSDEIVGRLVHYLKSHQLYDRSTILLLSDHGEGLGDHGETTHGLFLYEEAVRVPLIVKQESNAGAGRRVADLVQHIDLVPTVLDLVKAPIPGDLQGRSLKPLLDGNGHLPERIMYAEALYSLRHFGATGAMSATDGRYRYIKAPTEELYDLQHDAGEHENIATAKPDVGRAFEKGLGTLLNAQAAKDTSDTVVRDPKDRLQIVERYRQAVRAAGERRWPQALVLLQQILKDDPSLVDVWTTLATFANRVDRFDVGLEAYKHVIELTPSDPAGYLGAAATLLRQRKLDEAGDQAQLAADVAPARDGRSHATAHGLLARIALARHDADAARAEAALAEKSDKTLPVRAYVEGRLLYDAGKFADAMPFFEQALLASSKAGGGRIPELHFYAADTMLRLDRTSEAEAEFEEELREFPQNTRASAGLAALYQADGRTDEAEQLVSDLIHIAPTPDSYTLAARVWKSLGRPRQAAAVRTEARRMFRSSNP